MNTQIQKKIKTLKEARDKLSETFNCKAFHVAGIIEESAFCAAFIAAGVTGIVNPLAAMMITTSHGMALNKNIKKLRTTPPRRPMFSPAFSF